MTQCQGCRKKIRMPVSHTTDRRGRVTMIITTTNLKNHRCG